MKILDAASSDISIYFTHDEMITCYHSGTCDSGTRYIQSINRELLSTIPINNACKVLVSYGINDINLMKNDTVYQYILWLAAGNAFDMQNDEQYPSFDEDTGLYIGCISTY
jgi:hypothetical protein